MTDIKSELSDRAAAGREVYARNFATDPAEVERLMAERTGAAFTREAYEARGRRARVADPALTDRDRSIAVITALVAQNATDIRLSIVYPERAS